MSEKSANYLKTLEMVATIATDRDLILNPESARVEKIVGLLTRAQEKFGTYSCPCKDDHPICPCDSMSQEIALDGHCRCRLFYGK